MDVVRSEGFDGDSPATVRQPIHAPSCHQLDRACRLYSGGASVESFRAAFAGELSPEGMFLAWHAAVAANAIDERYPFTANRKR